MAATIATTTRWVKKGVQVTRAPFFTATLAPVLVGALAAWWKGSLHLGYLLLTLLGIAAINAGLDMSNDYYDHVSGNDTVPHDLTPFSGGSRTIQNGVLSPRGVLTWSLAFYAVGSLIGLYLASQRGWGVLAAGAVGLFLAFFHNAPPIRLYNLAPGVGELAVGIGCGPVIVLGAYYVQVQRFDAQALAASIPMGLLVAAILCVNAFPDIEADRLAGRRTLAVSLGRPRAVWVYVAMVVGAYVAIVLGVALGALPVPALLGVLTLPLAARAIGGVRAFHSHTDRLIPALATTIQLHSATGLLLSIAYVIAHYV